MGVHDMVVFWATCDECDWVSKDCHWYDKAQGLLDDHITSAEDH